jgi:hypothetical protein
MNQRIKTSVVDIVSLSIDDCEFVGELSLFGIGGDDDVGIIISPGCARSFFGRSSGSDFKTAVKSSSDIRRVTPMRHLIKTKHYFLS